MKLKFGMMTKYTMGTLLRDKFGPDWRMGWYRRSKNLTFGQNQNRGYPAIFAQKK